MSEAFTITFRAKVCETRYSDGTIASRRIHVPALTRKHVVNMDAARRSKRFGMFANYDGFPSIMQKAVEQAGAVRIGETLRIDLTKPLPESVTVDTSGFLATVTIRIPD